MAAPSGLVAISPYNGQANLQWTPVQTESPTAYLIQRVLLDLTNTPTPTSTGTLTPTDTPFPVAVVSSGTSAYKDYQVTNGRTYQYQVAVVDSPVSSVGIYSNPITYIPYSVPAAIQLVTVQNLHSDALDLSWEDPLSTYPVTNYIVYQYIDQIASSTPTYTFTQTYTPTVPTITPSGTLTATYSYTPTPSYTSTNTFTFTTSGTPTSPMSISQFMALATPIATTSSTNFTDFSPGNYGYAYFLYAVVAQDSQGNLGLLPNNPTNPMMAENLKPHGPTLSGLVSLASTPVIGTNGYGVRLIWNGALASEGVTAYQVLANGTPIATISYSTPVPTATYDDVSIPLSSKSNTLTNYSLVASNSYGIVTSDTVSENILAASVNGSLVVTPVATTNSVTLTWPQGMAGTYGLAGYHLYKGYNGVPTPFQSTPGLGTNTPTYTPTPFAVIYITPSATPTVMAVDTVANANHLSYWVVPFDGLTLDGVGAASTPVSLNLAPTPVTGITALTPVGNNIIQVNWGTASPGFYGTPQYYEVYREIQNPAPVDSVTPVPIATVPYSQNSFTDNVPGATPNAVIAYQVAAVDRQRNASDFSTLSNGVSAVTALAPPLAPMIQPSAGSSSTLVFSWIPNPASDGVDSYYLYGVGTNFTTTPSPTPLAIITPSPTMTIVATAAPWTVYLNYLQAHNAAGFSGPSTLSGIPVSDYQVTAVMTPGTRTMYLYWNLNPPAISTPPIDSFGIYRSNTTAANFTPIATVSFPTPGSPATPSFTDSNLSAGVSYYYRVTIRSDGPTTLLAESPLYPTMTSTPEASSGTWPNPPTGVMAFGGITQTNLFWTSNPATDNVLSYVIFHNGTPTTTVTPSPTMMAAFVETPQSVSTYWVVAQNAQGPSNSSVPSADLMAPSLTPTVMLTPPSWLSPTPNMTPAYPPLVWISGLTYSGSVSGYTISRSTDPGFSWSVTVASTASPTFFVSDPGVTGYINYYQILANNGSGVSANPLIVGSSSISLWPNPPNPLSVLAGPNAVTLYWSAPQGDVPVSIYDIYRSTFAGGPKALVGQITPLPMLTASPTPNLFVDSPPNTGTSYYYWVDAQAVGLVSTPSAEQAGIPMAGPTLQITALPSENILNWSPVTVSTGSSVTGYAVYRMAMPTPVFPNLTPVFVQIGPVLEGLSNTSYADTSIIDSTFYIYKVAATSNTNNSATVLSTFSNPCSQLALPMPVANLEAVGGDGLVQLRWNYQGPQTFLYNIQRKLGTAPDSAYQVLKNGYQGTDFLDTGLQDKTFYTYQVVTVDSTGLTSTAQTVNALPAKPPLVLNPIVSLSQGKALANDEAQLGNTMGWFPANLSLSGSVTFDPSTMYPLGGYHIYRSPNGGGSFDVGTFIGAVPVGPASAVTVNYLDPVQLVNGETYTYLVRAYDAPPDVPVTNVNMIHETPYDPITAYPLNAGAALDRNAIRPFGAGNEQVVNIRFVVTNPGNVEIKVYTLSGTFVKEVVNKFYDTGVWWSSWNAHNMNGTLVASGVYLVTVEMNGHQEIDKVAVIK